MTMQDLPGLPGRVEAELFRSVSGALKLIRAGKVATMAGHLGAINVWRDAAGRLRAHRCQYRATVSEVDTTTYAQLARWLEKELPLIGDFDRCVV